MDNSYIYRVQCHLPNVSDSSFCGQIGELVDHNYSSIIESSQVIIIANDNCGYVENVNLCSVYKLLYDLCSDVDNSISFEVIDEIYNDNFFQLYSEDQGYSLTAMFLSSMNKYKSDFIDSIDCILTGLRNSFYFLRFIGDECVTATELVGKICSSFSKFAYDLVPKCIDALQSKFFPPIIEIIYSSEIIDDRGPRKMMHTEMEQFFLHSCNSLERLIVSRLINYWNNFCNTNKNILSVLPESYYSNPFIHYCRYSFARKSRFVIPSVFSKKFSIYISFIALDRINSISDSFIGECLVELENIVRYKCFYIYNYVSSAKSNLRKLYKELPSIIKKEFYKKLSKKGVIDNLNNFLNELIICKSTPDLIEKKESILMKDIISEMYTLFERKAICNESKVIRKFQLMLKKSKKILLDDKYLCNIVDKWRVKICPEDNYNILSIRSKFSSYSKDIISNKFCSMLKENYKFSDGTFISKVDWDVIYKNLFPIIREDIRHVIDEERVEISRVLSKAHVVVDDNEVNDSNIVTREATSEEKVIVLKFAINKIHVQTRHLFKRIWKDLLKIEDDFSCNDSMDSEEDISFDMPVFAAVEDVDSSVINIWSRNESLKVGSESIDLIFAAFGVDDNQIINRWGINLHPDDDSFILFMRRKLLSEIKSNIHNLFSRILENTSEFNGINIVNKHLWSSVSKELIPISLKSVESIIENYYLELDLILSRSRIIEITKRSTKSWFIEIRKITDNEKSSLMVRAKKCIDKNLKISIRLLWISLTRTSKYTGYGYKETSGDIDREDVDIDGSWGVKLRYNDNIAILNLRKEFSSEIKNIIYDKFYGMLKNKYKFGNNDVIGRFSWRKMSKKLLPIAQEEINLILKRERIGLETILSRSRVITGSSDRNITNEEKSTILEKIMNLIHRGSKCLVRKAWLNVISSFDDYNNSKFSEKKPDTTVSDPISDFLSSADVTDIYKSQSRNAEDINFLLGINLRYEDSDAIFKAKKEFLSDIRNCAHNKFCEIIKNGYKLDDGDFIYNFSWEKISNKVFPIVKKEIDTIVDRERSSMHDLLLKSRAVVFSPDESLTSTRELLPDEISSAIETITGVIYKQSREIFRLTWIDVTNLLNKTFSKSKECNNYDIMGAIDLDAVVPVRSGVNFLYSPDIENLSEIDAVDLDNIRLEFIGSLGSIIDKTINELLVNVDTSSLGHEFVLSKVNSSIHECSYNLFKDGGFLKRVKSLLFNSRVVESSGGYRSITDCELRCIFKAFMDRVYDDKEYLVKRRISKFTRSTSIY
ncbi:hypothetical protein [Candidatus Ichthyocystis sparus]|uniref:hypothetical protein n=1 Tax=Candidatus Ichthyocystis sparus TaxID=1561004 RepID=UPI000B814461|nr:hypothetical protein [Candidatus Ichthyocystis sparus]